jgi:topoisomerase-4 subunit B
MVRQCAKAINLIPTSAGGTHESGLRDGLFTAVKFHRTHSLCPKGVRSRGRAGYVRRQVLDPQFQRPDHERLNSRDAVRPTVSSFVRPSLELWLNQHVDPRQAGRTGHQGAAQTRQKAGQKVEKTQTPASRCCPAS